MTPVGNLYRLRLRLWTSVNAIHRKLVPKVMSAVRCVAVFCSISAALRRMSSCDRVRNLEDNKKE